MTRGNAKDSGYARAADDWYAEQPSAVHALFDVERFEGTIYDPTCGAGNIPKTAIARGYTANGSDLIYRGYGHGGIDFLQVPQIPVANIVFNPPYRKGLVERLILHALSMATHKVAALLQLKWLEGKNRYKQIFSLYPPARIWVFSSRISIPPGGIGIKASHGFIAFCWIVWDRAFTGKLPTLGWIEAKAA